MEPREGGALEARLRESLSGLAARLEDWRQALAAYAEQVAPAAARVVGRAWAEAAAALEPAPAAPAAEGLEGLFDACDRPERRARALAGAAETVLGREAREAAERPMSHSFAEGLAALRRRAAAAAREAAAAGAAALEAATAAGGEAAGAGEGRLGAAFEAAPGRGQLATEVYVRALVCLRAAARLEAAKDRALGGEPDTPRAGAEDAGALAEYHPLQAMSAAPPAFGPPRPLGPAGPAPLGLALPRARLAVVYDLGPLVDRRRAAEFGPLASALSGLSAPLIARLRTIRAEPMARRAGEAAPPPAGLRWATTDNGATQRALRPPGFEAGAPGAWAPLAGAPPRASEYAAAAEALILGAIRAERKDGWGLDLRERFEAALASAPEPAPAEGELLAALLDAFEEDYAAAPPADAEALRELVAPRAFAPGGYIARATAALGERALRAPLLRVATRAPRLLPALEVEARVTGTLQALEAARRIWRRLRDTFEAVPPAEPTEASPAARRAAHQRAVRQCVGAALRAEPPAVASPTLKLYAAAAAR